MRMVGTVVKMHIEKFGREVLIEEDHALAIAERESATRPSPAGQPDTPVVESRKQKRER